MTKVTEDEYLAHIAEILKQENVEPHVQRQLLDAVSELLKYYSLEYVRELLPSLLKT